MPWSHCDVQFILDTENCPSCGVDKAVWTIQIEKTRQLVIGKRKKRRAWIDVELRDTKGKPSPGKTYRAEFANGRVKTGELDADGRARFKQLFPGPVQVTFPDTELETTEPKTGAVRKGKRQVLSAPLADAVRRRPEPLAGWELQTLAASAERPAPTLAATQLLTVLPLAEPASPPAAEEGEEDPTEEGDPLKVELPLQVTFASRAQAQSWLLRSNPQVHVDGERVPAGAYVKDRHQIVIQFRVPPGEHHVLISAQKNSIRTIYLSKRVAIESEGTDEPPAEKEEASAPDSAWTGTFPTPGRAGANERAESPATGKGKPPSARDVMDKDPAKGASASALATKGIETSKRQPASSAGGGASAASVSRFGGSSSGQRGASANPLSQLIASEYSPDPIGLSREQIDRGAGELYVFQPPADTLKASVPLHVTFASRREAQRWLLRANLRVHVNGEEVAHAAHLEGSHRVLVQFRLEPGDSHVMISGTRQAAAGEIRTVYLSRRMTLSDGSGSGAVQPAPPPKSPPPRKGPTPPKSAPARKAPAGKSAPAGRKSAPAVRKSAPRKGPPSAGGAQSRSRGR